MSKNETTWVVATPGCGAAVRALTLPERRLLDKEDHEASAQILESLRQALSDRLGAVNSDDDDARQMGSILNLRLRWERMDSGRKAMIFELVRTGEETADSFVLDLRFIEQRTADALRELSIVTGQTPFPEVSLSWCVVALPLAS